MNDDPRTFFRHRDGCPGGNPTDFMGRRGDLMTGCRACSAVTPLYALEQAADDAARAEAREAAHQTARNAAAFAAHSPRYWLTCIRCSDPYPVPSQRLRIPICNYCNDH